VYPNIRLPDLDLFLLSDDLMVANTLPLLKVKASVVSDVLAPQTYSPGHSLFCLYYTPREAAITEKYAAMERLLPLGSQPSVPPPAV
jgi:hypothetical protein